MRRRVIKENPDETGKLINQFSGFIRILLLATCRLWLSGLQAGVYSLDLDVLVMLQVPVVLLANVFLDLTAGNPTDVPTDCERFGVCAGIIHRGFVVHIVIGGTREAFDKMHFSGMHITVAGEPVSFIETDGVDYQRVSF